MYTRVLVEALFVFRSEPDLFKHYIKKNFNERIINKTKDFSSKRKNNKKYAVRKR